MCDARVANCVDSAANAVARLENARANAVLLQGAHGRKASDAGADDGDVTVEGSRQGPQRCTQGTQGCRTARNVRVTLVRTLRTLVTLSTSVAPTLEIRHNRALPTRRDLCLCLRLTALLASLVVVASLPAQTPAKRLALADYLEWEDVADPQLSPDGRQIVYTRRWVDKLNDHWEASLWIMNVDGSRNRFLVNGSSPKWSPDGTRLVLHRHGASQPARSSSFGGWMPRGERPSSPA